MIKLQTLEETINNMIDKNENLNQNESEKYIELYSYETEAISKGFNINNEHLRNMMPQIYSEDVFCKMINIDLKELNKIQQKVDDNDNERKIFIVGDIHGSVIQLFAPLIKAKIIKNVRYSFNEDKFEFDFSKNINRDTRIVYTGDIVYRGIHAHLMAMIESLITIILKFNFKIVNWVFGNHDMEFIKYGGIPRYTLDEYKMSCPRFSEIHLLFQQFALKNPYKFGYALDANIISNLNLNYENSDEDLNLNKNKIDILIELPVNNQILITHTIQTNTELLQFFTLYNKIFNTKISYYELKSTSDFIYLNQTKLLYKMNECFTNIVKLMLESKEKYFEVITNYGRLLNLTVWNRPFQNIKYIDFGYKYHFIGHTPRDNIEYYDILNNSNKIKNTIILSDLNTFNNEHYDGCMWYSLINFKNDEMQIKENKKSETDSISVSDSESDYSDDEDECRSIYHQIILNINDKIKFNNFTLKLISNRVDYPDDMLNRDDITCINAAISIYDNLINY